MGLCDIWTRPRLQPNDSQLCRSRDQREGRAVPVGRLGEPEASFGVTAAHALEAGEIDGFWANAMGAETAVRAGVGTVVLDVCRGIGPSNACHYTFSALVGNDRMIHEKPDVMAGAVRGVRKAQRALHDDPDLAGRVGERLFPSPQAQMIVDIVRRDREFYEAGITAESVRGVDAFAKAGGLSSGSTPYDSVVATQFTALWKP